MPELPEIITITRQLNTVLSSKKIISVHQSENIKHLELSNTPKIMCRRITATKLIGKTILIETEANYSILIHLGMTGRLLYNSTDKYEKCRFTFGDNSYLAFSDVRKFGYLKILTREQVRQKVENIGPNALRLNTNELYAATQKSKTDIKTLLLNQKIISGLGNVYATDALFIAKVHPQALAKSLNPNQTENLCKAIKKILNEGIKNRGISMNRYVDAFGKTGNQQNHFRVYKKAGQKCSKCGNIIESIKQKGRTTYFCPRCQKFTSSNNRKF
jgi:formamidopyrimidine-DNA glycosylase